MRLKSLELQGFKSFPDKTLLSFPHPITAIVGPNGSGKSNLSDAIRWVLGEQSARSLRGGKMEDVIFGGAQDRRRQGFAQVTLTLEQCQDLLPDGGQEVAVTRRYYRSGESEYAINGTAVRLRDVNELFMDTGLGRGVCPSLGREKLMRFSRPKAPSGGKSSRRRRGSPIAATKRRRPSANWSAPRRTCCGLGTNWRNWSSSAPPCRPRRNRPRPTWPCGRSCGCWKSPFGWTSWTSSVPRVRPWKRIWPRPAGAGELLCPGRSALCQGGDPFAAAAGPAGPGGSTTGPVPGQRSPAPGQPSAGGTSPGPGAGQ